MKRKFYGRKWLFEKIHDTVFKGKAVEQELPRYRGVAILGQAGSGKTSVCQQLLHPNENDSIQKALSANIIAYHSCESDSQQSCDVGQFIRNIALQLGKHEKLAKYKELYNSNNIQDIVNKEHQNEEIINVFKKVIVDPIKSCDVQDHRLLLIVDSIDESLFEGGSSQDTDVITICNLLVISLQQNLFPPWLRLIITARRQSRDMMKMFSGLKKITLDDLKKSYVVKDVQQYILDRLDSEPALRKHLTRHTAEQFNLLHVKSNGCILYLEQILNNVIKGVLTVEDISDIPGTLNGLYLWLCQQLFSEDVYNKHLRSILETLLAAKQSLSFNDLCSIMKLVNDGVSDQDIHNMLDTLSPILVQEDGCYRFVHHSFSEWLIDVKHCTRRFLCSVAKGHAMLAVYFMCGGKTLTLLENERFLSHLLQSQYPSSDPTKVEQWLKWTGVRAENAGSLRSESSPKLDHVKAAFPQCETMYHTQTKSDVESGACMNYNHEEEDMDWTPLLKVAHDGDCEKVHALIQKGADVNFIDRSGKTALSVASSEGHVKIVHDLINCGAEINTRDSCGCTPLRAAARYGSSDIVTLLLKHGAIPDLADNHQRNAMRAAAWGGYTDIGKSLVRLSQIYI